MSATRPFFISQKEINLVDHMNEELIDDILSQEMMYNGDFILKLRTGGCRAVYDPETGEHMSRGTRIVEAHKKHIAQNLQEYKMRYGLE